MGTYSFRNCGLCIVDVHFDFSQKFLPQLSFYNDLPQSKTSSIRNWGLWIAGMHFYFYWKLLPQIYFRNDLSTIGNSFLLHLWIEGFGIVFQFSSKLLPQFIFYMTSSALYGLQIPFALQITNCGCASQIFWNGISQISFYNSYDSSISL